MVYRNQIGSVPVLFPYQSWHRVPCTSSRYIATSSCPPRRFRIWATTSDFEWSKRARVVTSLLVVVIFTSCCSLLDRGVGWSLRGRRTDCQYITTVLRIVYFHLENQVSVRWAVPLRAVRCIFSSNTPCFSEARSGVSELITIPVCVLSTASVLLCGLGSTAGSSSNPATIPSTSSTSRVIPLRTGKKESTTESIMPWAIQSEASKKSTQF